MSGIPWLPIIMKQGDTFRRPLAITVKDDQGLTVPVNLTGTTITFHLRERGGAEDILAIPLTLTNVPGGIAQLTLTKEQTATLSSTARYEYEVELLDGAGEISTPVQGSVAVLPDRG